VEHHTLAYWAAVLYTFSITGEHHTSFQKEADYTKLAFAGSAIDTFLG
jgi:hypothetical protein